MGCVKGKKLPKIIAETKHHKGNQGTAEFESDERTAAVFSTGWRGCSATGTRSAEAGWHGALAAAWPAGSGGGFSGVSCAEVSEAVEWSLSFFLRAAYLLRPAGF